MIASSSYLTREYFIRHLLVRLFKYHRPQLSLGPSLSPPRATRGSYTSQTSGCVLRHFHDRVLVLTSLLDSLPSHFSHSRTSILLVAYSQSSRCSCSCTILWAKLLDRPLQARQRWWHCPSTLSSRTAIDI